MILKALRTTVIDPRGKFRPNWARPYIVKKILPGGAVELVDINGDAFYNLTNLDQLKKYYVQVIELVALLKLRLRQPRPEVRPLQ